MKTLTLIFLLAALTFAQADELSTLRARQSELRLEKVRLMARLGMRHESVLAKEAEIQALEKQIRVIADARMPRTAAGWSEYDGETGWREVARTARDPITFWFYERHIERPGLVEVWLKQYDPEPKGRTPKAQRVSHILHFTVFHCRDRRVSIQKSIAYGPGDKVLGTVTGGMYREPLPPESVYEAMWEHFCLAYRRQG